MEYYTVFAQIWRECSRIMRVASCKQQNPRQKKSLAFFLPTSLVQKGSSIAFVLFWMTRQQRVAWSGRVEIACQNKNGIKHENDLLKDCHINLSTLH